MSKLGQLRERRSAKAEAARTLDNKYPKDQRMPADAIAQMDALLNEIESIDRLIDGEVRAAQDLADVVDATEGAGVFEVSAGQPVRALREPKDIRTHYARRGIAAERDVTLGDFARGVLGLPTTDAVRASLSTGTDADGGYLLPTTVMPRFLEALVPASSVLQAGASILPLAGAGAKSFTIAGIETLPQAAWRAEAGAVAVSAPTFRAVTVVPRSLAVIVKLTRELAMDAAGLGDALNAALAQAFAKEVDRAALRGSGTAPEPRGLLNTAGCLTVDGTGGSVYTSPLIYRAMTAGVRMIRQWNAPMPTAAIMSPASLTAVGTLIDANGQPLQPPPLLANVRMLDSSQIPDDLTVGSTSNCTEIYFSDFSGVYIAMREQISIARLGELYAATGEIGIVAHARVDVVVTYPKALAIITNLKTQPAIPMSV